jgi:hypothetical protein
MEKYEIRLTIESIATFLDNWILVVEDASFICIESSFETVPDIEFSFASGIGLRD